MSRLLIILVCGLVSVTLAITASPSQAQEAVAQVPEDLDIPMFRMPQPEQPGSQMLFQKKLAELWIQALLHDSDETKIKAGESFARAYELGYDLALQAKDELLAEYARPEASSKVKTSLANALTVMDIREAAPLFVADLENASPQLARAIGPPLARWQNPQAIKLWTEKLQDPTTRQQELKSCVQLLHLAQATECVDDFLKLVNDQGKQMSLRMEAAKAASQLSPSGLEDAAQTLIERDAKVFVDRLLATQLLAEHDSPRAIEQLQARVPDAQPTVAVLAAKRLKDIDIELLYPNLLDMSQREEPVLRKIAVEGLDTRRSEEDTRRLLEMLNDLHPEVRHNARVVLEQLAELENLRPIILETTTSQLAELRQPEEWRRLEQLAVLAGNLDHEPPALDLFELLQHPRPETSIAAAWGLSRIQVAETLPLIVDYANQIADKCAADSKTISWLHEQQLTHLFHTLGFTEYEPAKPMLVRYIPKNGYQLGTTGRAAGIWALGLIQKGVVDEDLAGQLAARMLDSASSPPEAPVVRRMAAVTLGRMKAASQLEALDTACTTNGVGDPVGWCAFWAIEQINGQPIPPVGIRESYEVGWFLTPTGKPEPVTAQPRD